jgi:hydroxymethylglutaryl-CoA reductase (NADPH)
MPSSQPRPFLSSSPDDECLGALELSGPSGLYRLRVLELSEHQLVARSIDEHVPPSLPCNLANVRLVPVSGATVTLPSLYAEPLPTRLDGEKIIHFVPQDSATRAALWQASRPTVGRPEAPPAPDSLPLPRIPARGEHSEAARLKRLTWLRQHTSSSLDALSTTKLDPQRLCFNVENLVGAVEIPVGIAGPLWIDGDFARGAFCVPLATTEGALVASATRGARALSASGGARTRVVHQRMTRAPLFVFDDLRGATTFARWAVDHLNELAAEARRISTHARLLQVEPFVIGDGVHLVFTYETGDAAGQNMTTACTWRACNWMLAEVRYLDGVTLRDFFIDGALSGDKRMNVKSLVSGRGIRVIAEAALSERVCRELLGVAPQVLQRAYPKSLLGALQGGSVGYTVNAPNVIAALFAATGQDLACAHESGLGLFSLEMVGEELRASITLTNLVIGTVGGGTHLPVQQQLLASMGCAGSGGVQRLAEITAAFCLALELSTMAAIAAGTFVAAHEKLGRNRPRGVFMREHLTANLLSEPLARSLGQPVSVQAVELRALPAEHGLLHSLCTAQPGRLLGLHAARVTAMIGASSTAVELDYVVKVKPKDSEVLRMLDASAAAWGGRIESCWARARPHTQFVQAHERELNIYQQTDPRFRQHAPNVLLTLRDRERDAYVVVLERLSPAHALLDAIDDPDAWSERLLDAAIRGLAQLHAIWLGREAELLATSWLGPVPSLASSQVMAELCLAVEAPAAAVMPGRFPARVWELRRRLAADVPGWWRDLEAQPRTLAHNDFQPRNVAIVDPRGRPRLCAYDWELATLLPPQHDLAELLTFTLRPDARAADVDHYLELQRRSLEETSGHGFDPVTWRSGYRACLCELLINRFTFYILADCLRPQASCERGLRTLCRLLELEGL